MASFELHPAVEFGVPEGSLDDYDLLTVGEAGPLLAKLPAAERDGLIAPRQQPDPGRASIQPMEQPISLLKSSGVRPRQQSLTAEACTHRLGLRPRDAQFRAARWARQ
jgi:hypothetical protein